ncbi:PDZ domain-containing protein, partial [Candidatus Azambacteria bacterium]|nr:PDZ domain-containing protein [Candidatus Azambacteria bacterium]
MQNKYFRQLGLVVFGLVLLVVVFNFGFYFGKNSIPAIDRILGVSNKKFTPENKIIGDLSSFGKSDLSSVDFNIFWESWKLIEDNWVNRDKINRQDLVYGSVAGLVKSLNDPYTVFFNPTESKKFIEDVSGSFGGIGAEVGIRKNQLLIVAPLKDSPAEKADLRAKDRILKIDKKATQDLTIEEAVALIRGEKGTEVTLLIDRDGFEKLKEFKIKRDIIKVPVLKSEIKDGVAIVSMYSFNQELLTEFKKASKEIIKSGVKKIIIDLRNNPGGYLDVAQEIGSYFLPLGKVITIEKYANDE